MANKPSQHTWLVCTTSHSLDEGIMVYLSQLHFNRLQAKPHIKKTQHIHSSDCTLIVVKLWSHLLINTSRVHIGQSDTAKCWSVVESHIEPDEQRIKTYRMKEQGMSVSGNDTHQAQTAMINKKKKKIWLQKKSILRSAKHNLRRLSVLLNSIIKLKENRCEKPRRWCCCSCVVDGIPRNKLRTVVLTTHTAQEQKIRQPERLKKWIDFAIYFCSFLQASFLGKFWCARGFGIGIRVHCALDSCGKNMIPEQCFGKRKNISLYGMCWLVSFSHQTLYFICHTETPLTGRAQATIDNIPIWSVILIHILVIANICQKGFSFPSNRQYEYTQHTIWHTFIYTHILGTPKTERQVERLQLRLSFVLYMV